MTTKYQNLVGKQINSWTVVEVKSCKDIVVRCNCGSEFVRRIYSIVSGKSKSCGCHHGSNYIHGHCNGNIRTPEFTAWRNAVQRTTDVNHPMYPNYGGRGIEVCPEWRKSYLAFYQHIGPRPSANHTLDRIDVELGYEPGNVHWLPRRLQNSNKTNTVWITVGERTQALPRWAEEANVDYNQLYYMHRSGKDVVSFLTNALSQQ